MLYTKNTSYVEVSYLIVDITGVPINPGNHGNDCPGNGQHSDAFGVPIECCCDECDYFLCCYGPGTDQDCLLCKDAHCPRAGQQ